MEERCQEFEDEVRYMILNDDLAFSTTNNIPAWQAKLYSYKAGFDGILTRKRMVKNLNTKILLTCQTFLMSFTETQ